MVLKINHVPILFTTLYLIWDRGWIITIHISYAFEYPSKAQSNMYYASTVNSRNIQRAQRMQNSPKPPMAEKLSHWKERWTAHSRTLNEYLKLMDFNGDPKIYFNSVVPCTISNLSWTLHTACCSVKLLKDTQRNEGVRQYYLSWRR